MAKRLTWAILGWSVLITLPFIIDFTLRAFDFLGTSSISNSETINGMFLFGVFAIISAIPFGIAFWKQSKASALSSILVVAYLTTAAYPYISLFYSCAAGIACV